VYALVVLSSLGCSLGSDRGEVLVFAATSLTDALEEARREYARQEDVDVKVSVSYGGSQALAQQIAQGAPADLFISAGEFPVRFLVDRGLVDGPGTAIVSNTLVAATRRGGVQLAALDELNTDAVQRIGIATPDLAPAGAYAKETLSNLGLWAELQPKLVMGADVRVTLAYLEAGNIDVALVYRTDARTSSDVVVLDIVLPETYSPVVYPAIIVRGSERTREAGDFLAFLRTDAASAIFSRHGFGPPP
jgi:molybdate transport system substrate-binding protein